jgi:hypothetical protein
MPKQKISGKELVADIHGGMTDSAIMEKYGLSSQGLQSAFTKLLNNGLLEQSQLDARATTSEKTHARPVVNARESDADIKSGVNQPDDIVFCPKCGAKRVEGAIFCGRCGNAFKIPSVEVTDVKQSLHTTASPISPEKGLAKETSSFACPACGTSLDGQNGECPACGIVVSKFQRKTGKRPLRREGLIQSETALKSVSGTGRTIAGAHELAGTALREVAEFQKVIILLVLGNLGVMLLAAINPIFYIIASLVLEIFCIYCLYRIGKAMKQPVAYLVAIIVFSIIPCINLVVLLLVNGMATRVLRTHGVRVGLLGAKSKDLDLQT